MGKCTQHASSDNVVYGFYQSISQAVWSWTRDTNAPSPPNNCGSWSDNICGTAAFANNSQWWNERPLEEWSDCSCVYVCNVSYFRLRPESKALLTEADPSVSGFSCSNASVRLKAPLNELSRGISQTLSSWLLLFYPRPLRMHHTPRAPFFSP